MIELHPYCAAWDPMEGPELQVLSESIRSEGLLNPIVLFEGQVLDGQNRQIACDMAGIEPEYAEFEGDDDAAFAYVKALNNARRHATPTMRAASVYRMDEARGARRATRGGSQKASIGNVADSPIRTIADRAIDADVSIRHQADVETVLRSDDEDLKKKMLADEVTAHKAATKVRNAREGQSVKPRKPAPTAQSVEDKLRERIALLDARIVELEVENKGLRNDLMESRDAGEELAHELEDMQALRDGEEGKRFAIVRQQLKSVTATRDTLMGEGQQLLKEVNRWKKRAEKAEGQLGSSGKK